MTRNFLQIAFWRFSILPFCTLFVLLGIGLTSANATCDPANDGYYGYSFIHPKMVNFNRKLAPFFLDFGQYYSNFFASQSRIYQDENIEEWHQRFCSNAHPNDIKAIVYDASRYDLEVLLAVMTQPGTDVHQIPRSIKKNSFTLHLWRNKCVETVEYLIFTRQCEVHTSAPADAWDTTTRDTVSMRRLVGEVLRKFPTVESHYLRLRYAYQAIRLAHYMKDYALTLSLIDDLLPKIDNDPSVVEHWIMGHKAGALYALGQRAEAAYLYSRVFALSPGKRESAFRSFKIASDEEWQACFNMCRNDHERAGLHAMRANASHALRIEEMRNIYRYEPQHPSLDMLLIKETQQLERDLLGISFNPRAENNRITYNIPRPEAGERVVALLVLVREWLAKGKLRNPELWLLTEGYLEMLAGNYYEAERTFAKVESNIDDEDYQEQLAVYRLVLRIMNLNSITPDMEAELAELPKTSPFYNDYPDIARLVNDKLRPLYREQGDGAKAYMMDYSINQLRANPDLEIIDELLALCAKRERNRFENEIVLKADGSTIARELLDVKSAFLLSQGKLEAAKEALLLLPEEYHNTLGLFNPFVRRFKDCVHCSLPDSVTAFNRLELVNRLLELEFSARAETKPDKAAALYFQIGEAYYNMSYFGQAWRAADLFRSGASAERASRAKGIEVFPYPGLPLGNRENMSMDLAQRYFNQARLLARSREIQAAAAYMAAKCERNESYVRKSTRTYDYFQVLLDNYQDTELYGRIITECRDFQAFVLK